MPHQLQPLESGLKKLLKERVERGHVTLTVRWLEEPERTQEFEVDLERARGITEALRSLKEELDLPGEIDLGVVVRQPSVINVGEGDRGEVDLEEVGAVVRTALDELIGQRRKEGEALRQEIARLLDLLSEQLNVVERQAPERKTNEMARLKQSVAELLEGASVDENRLMTELALYADRVDVTEEIVRLKSHLESARDALDQEGASGKVLGFLSQEMLREINTIGSKANDAVISEAVIAMKSELEKLREQVENVE